MLKTLAREGTKTTAIARNLKRTPGAHKAESNETWGDDGGRAEQEKGVNLGRAHNGVTGAVMLKVESRADLEALHTGTIKESLNLEYKASAAVDGSDSQKLEMARDASAFANADGGQIVYGMSEREHEPAGLDGGIDRVRFPPIWFEQVLQQHVTPLSATGLMLPKLRQVMRSNLVPCNSFLGSATALTNRLSIRS
jgi:hypothetical protein